jgi:hypothetical protein
VAAELLGAKLFTPVTHETKPEHYFPYRSRSNPEEWLDLSSAVTSPGGEGLSNIG